MIPWFRFAAVNEQQTCLCMFWTETGIVSSHICWKGRQWADLGQKIEVLGPIYWAKELGPFGLAIGLGNSRIQCTHVRSMWEIWTGVVNGHFAFVTKTTRQYMSEKITFILLNLTYFLKWSHHKNRKDSESSKMRHHHHGCVLG